MDDDNQLESGLGGALSGAGTGASIGSVVPGIGTAIGAAAGGLIGGVTGLLTKKKKPELYQNPYAGQITGAANQLMYGNAGAQQAAATRGQITGRANRAMERAANQPGFGSNAAVMSAIQDQADRGANEGIQSANIAGAELDTRNKAEGAKLLQGQQKGSAEEWAANQAIKNRPGFFQQQLMNSLSAGAGALAGGLGGNKSAASDTTTLSTSPSVTNSNPFGLGPNPGPVDQSARINSMFGNFGGGNSGNPPWNPGFQGGFTAPIGGG